MQQQQMNESSQVSETKDDLTSMTSGGRYIMLSATFMIKVGVCQTFKQDEYSTKSKDTLQEQMCVTSHLRKTVNKCKYITDRAEWKRGFDRKATNGLLQKNSRNLSRKKSKFLQQQRRMQDESR